MSPGEADQFDKRFHDPNYYLGILNDVARIVHGITIVCVVLRESPLRLEVIQYPIIKMGRRVTEHPGKSRPWWLVEEMVQPNKSFATTFTRDMIVMAVTVLAEAIITSQEEMYVKLRV